MTEKRLFSNRVGQIPPSAIHAMTALSKTVPDVAFLSWAKPTSSAPAHIHEAAAAAIAEGRADGYSETRGLGPLREEIARKLRQENGIDASPAQILVTVGAIEGISAALMAAIDPGDEVILPSPTYSTHINQVLLASGRPVFAPTVEREGFRLDLDALHEVVSPKTRAILYCSPANPTGAVFGRQALSELARIALEHDLIVITDEAYEYFTFDGAEHFAIASIPEMRDHAISCFTFTKNYAMTGWRVGYVHASESWIAQLGKPHIAFAICAPVVSQYAALAALQGPQDCIQAFRAKYLSARDRMCARLDRLGSVFSYQRPRGSYLMFPRILLEEGRDSKAFCEQLLLRARVSTTPGCDFGPTAEGHLRLSFCVPEEMIDTAFDRMERYFGAGG
ncbi:MAG: aminotransferase class I/II-fold pyridoxal phosphate-dependent enzyme [Deltaproteobacteria bacterium]|nr:aminotransferase class I/II-fold pyridoxal phosphate-dependent enzyme [Deltaproteobacteria bacterium]